MKQVQEGQATYCYHCGDSCEHTKIRLGEHYFCCDGCKMVYQLLQEHELCTYYNLNEAPGMAQRHNVRHDKFAFLDDEKIVRQLVDFTDAKQTNITFYLPQMHCSSCLWLLEHVHTINKGIVRSRVNFSKKEVLLTFKNESCSLRQVAETLAAIGYEPHLNLADIDHLPRQSTDKSRLYRIGIAGFCFSNIMIMSLPEYFTSGGHVEADISRLFQVLSVVLSLPVLFYCATPFFSAAWKGLRNRFLNIDLPIALAIAITFGRSIYELLTHTGSGYLDSMSGIVFFMLVGRFMQDRTYRSLSFDRDFKSFFPISVDTKRGDDFVPVMIAELKPDDIIRIHTHELIPADALLSNGQAAIDYSFVSGESMPVHAAIGEIIYAGGQQMGGSLELVVIKEVSQSYLTDLWNKDIMKEQKQEPSFIHSVSRYFTLAVLLLGLAAGIWWGVQAQYSLMWHAMTTVLIVACPCALLLSATFTNGNILRIFSKNKLYLRHPDVIEDIANTEHIVFDKTGTLTQSKQQSVSYEGIALSEAQKSSLAILLSQSGHPLSQAVYAYLDMPAEVAVPHCKEWPGKGIEGWIGEQHIKAGSALFTGYLQPDPAISEGASVFVCFDDKVPGRFTVRNQYREGFATLMQDLGAAFPISVLSGDNNSEATFLKSVLGANATIRFRQQPEDKLRFIRELQETKGHSVLMVGDGLNDAGALKQSTTGIAITEGNNNFTPASDGIMDAARFSSLGRFIALAKSGRRIIMASFVLSVLYNIIGLFFALQGTLSPVIAAILMPASSISIILLTYGMTEWMAKRYGLS